MASRRRQRCLCALAAAAPALALMFGALVAVVAIGVVLPMVRLVDSIRPLEVPW